MQFDIITYMANMTGYTFTTEQLKRIAIDRGVYDVMDLGELTRRDKNLLLADMLFIIITSPSSGGSITKQHGDFSVTIGASSITNISELRKLMLALYDNPDKELNELVSTSQGGVGWIQEYD